MSQNFVITEKDDCMVIKFEPCCPKIDARNYEDVQREILDILKGKESEDKDIKSLIFDLSNIVYVSSAGLRMFSAVNRVAIDRCIDYKLVDLIPDVYRMFELTGYVSQFRIEEQVSI